MGPPPAEAKRQKQNRLLRTLGIAVLIGALCYGIFLYMWEAHLSCLRYDDSITQSNIGNPLIPKPELLLPADQAVYYSFYRYGVYLGRYIVTAAAGSTSIEFRKGDSLWNLFTNFDHLEYPDPVNVLARFNAWPEFILAALWGAHADYAATEIQRNLTIYFKRNQLYSKPVPWVFPQYAWSAIAWNALGLTCLVIIAGALGGWSSATLAVVFFLQLSPTVTRSYWAIAARETWALPLWWAQLLCSVLGGPVWLMSLLNCGFLLSWKFGVVLLFIQMLASMFDRRTCRSVWYGCLLAFAISGGTHRWCVISLAFLIAGPVGFGWKGLLPSLGTMLWACYSARLLDLSFLNQFGFYQFPAFSPKDVNMDIFTFGPDYSLGRLIAHRLGYENSFLSLHDTCSQNSIPLSSGDLLWGSYERSLAVALAAPVALSCLYLSLRGPELVDPKDVLPTAERRAAERVDPKVLTTKQGASSGLRQRKSAVAVDTSDSSPTSVPPTEEEEEGKIGTHTRLYNVAFRQWSKANSNRLTILNLTLAGLGLSLVHGQSSSVYFPFLVVLASLTSWLPGELLKEPPSTRWSRRVQKEEKAANRYRITFLSVVVPLALVLSIAFSRPTVDQVCEQPIRPSQADGELTRWIEATNMLTKPGPILGAPRISGLIFSTVNAFGLQAHALMVDDSTSLRRYRDLMRIYTRPTNTSFVLNMLREERTKYLVMERGLCSGHCEGNGMRYRDLYEYGLKNVVRKDTDKNAHFCWKIGVFEGYDKVSLLPKELLRLHLASDDNYQLWEIQYPETA